MKAFCAGSAFASFRRCGHAGKGWRIQRILRARGRASGPPPTGAGGSAAPGARPRGAPASPARRKGARALMREIGLERNSAALRARGEGGDGRADPKAPPCGREDLGRRLRTARLRRPAGALLGGALAASVPPAGAGAANPTENAARPARGSGPPPRGETRLSRPPNPPRRRRPRPCRAGRNSPRDSSRDIADDSLRRRRRAAPPRSRW